MNVPVNYPYITKVTAGGFNKSVSAVSGLAQMIMPWVSPLTILVGADSADSKVEATVLVTSSENSWVSPGQANMNPQQNWQQIDMGYESAFKAITGGIFEFGFSDALQQMVAGYLYELVHGEPLKPTAACVTPEQAALSHRLFTASLESQKNASTVAV